jgi:hypothetical protein
MRIEDVMAPMCRLFQLGAAWRSPGLRFRLKPIAWPGPVDPGRVVKLRGNLHPLAQPRSDQGKRSAIYPPVYEVYRSYGSLRLTIDVNRL